MKTAAVIFVALTVFSGLFLETSAKPSFSTGLKKVGNAIEDVGNNVKKIVNAGIEDVELLRSGETTKEVGEILKLLSELISNLVKEAENEGTVADQKLKKIREIIERIKAIVAKLWEKVGEKTKELVKKALQVLKKVLEKVREVLKPIIKEVLSKLKEAIDRIAEKIKEALANNKEELKELFTKLKEALEKLKQKIRDWITAYDSNDTEVVGGLMKEMEAMVTEIKNLDLSSLPNELKDSMNTLVEQLTDLSKGDDIIELVKNLLAILVAEPLEVDIAIIEFLLLEESTEELGENLKLYLEHMSEVAKEAQNDGIVTFQKLEKLRELKEKIKVILAKLWEKLGEESKERVKRVLQAVKSRIEELRELLKPILKELVSKVKEAIPSIVEKIKEALANCDGELKELYNKLKELLEKILDWITANKSDVTEVSNKEMEAVMAEYEEIELTLISVEIKELITSCMENISVVITFGYVNFETDSSEAA